MAETSNQPFTMHGAREAIAAGLVQVRRQVETLERAVFENPAQAFDLARYIAEAACRTILTERGVTWEEKWEVPRLVNEVCNVLPMVPYHASTEAEARESVKRMLGGLKGALQAVCELRGGYGFSSHGPDGEKPAMETMQALLAAQTTDAIVGFLFRAHRGDRRKELAARADRDRTTKALIDFSYEEPALIAGRPYPHSDALMAVDKDGWEEWATAFEESRNILDDLRAKFAGILHPGLAKVSFIHHDGAVYLRIVDTSQTVRVYDASAADSGEPGDQKFPATCTPDENADELTKHWDDWGLAILFPVLLKDEDAQRLNEETKENAAWVGEMLARESRPSTPVANHSRAAPQGEEESTNGNV